MLNEWTVFFGLLFWIGTPVIAHAKNRPWGSWLVGAILLGPVAFLLVICMPALAPEPEARCPWCKGGVRNDAVVCMHCARDMRESPAPKTVLVPNTTTLSRAPVLEATARAGTSCRYCGEDGSNVRGLYGQTYHRACHTQALTT